MKLLWPLLSLGVVLTLVAACDDDHDDTTPPPVGSSSLGDSGVADGSASSDSGSRDSGSDSGPAAEAECAPGASRCCTRYSDGTKACSPPPTILNTCVAGNCADVTPKPIEVLMETCGTDGRWLDQGQTCSTNCTPGSSLITVGCGYCGPSGAARCLDVSCTCE